MMMLYFYKLYCNHVSYSIGTQYLFYAKTLAKCENKDQLLALFLQLFQQLLISLLHSRC